MSAFSSTTEDDLNAGIAGHSTAHSHIFTYTGPQGTAAFGCPSIWVWQPQIAGGPRVLVFCDQLKAVRDRIESNPPGTAEDTAFEAGVHGSILFSLGPAGSNYIQVPNDIPKWSAGTYADGMRYWTSHKEQGF